MCLYLCIIRLGRFLAGRLQYIQDRYILLSLLFLSLSVSVCACCVVSRSCAYSPIVWLLCKFSFCIGLREGLKHFLPISGGGKAFFCTS